MLSDKCQGKVCSGGCTSLFYPCLTCTMNSTQPRTPPHPHIDQAQFKGTPRHHKTPNQNQNHGIKVLHKSIDELWEELKRILKLTFTPEEWQAYLIQRVKHGYNTIFLAGTGYGKSLVFEGLAALGGQRKVTIVISPLKSLWKDQVRELVKDQTKWHLLWELVEEAKVKGIKAMLMVQLWAKVSMLIQGTTV